MRRAVLPCVLLLALGCSQKEVPAGAVKVSLTFQGFGPGCVEISANDSAGHQASTSLLAVPRGSTKVVALEGSWGAGLTVVATAYERECGNHPVAHASQSTTVPSTGVGTLSLTLGAPDNDQDGYVAVGAGGTDCDDSASGAGIHPGAVELCNGKDDNCDGNIDEGLPSQDFFRDDDQDGYGQDATRTSACQKPGANWVLQGGDCNDSPDGGSAIHPGATEKCNGVDDDCNGTVDDPFLIGSGCLASGCQGEFQCSGLDASTCVAPNYYLDQDGDGHGAGPALASCPVSATVSLTDDDCDDSDPTTYPDAGDVCDQRDNTCGVGGSVDPSCPRALWAPHVEDAGTNGWNTASADVLGNVWFAGNANAIALHTDAGFADESAGCATLLAGNWHASWTDGTGTVYLGGENTTLAGQPRIVSVAQDGTCQSASGFTNPAGIIYGLVGFPGGSGVDLFASSDNGKIYRNDGTSASPTGATKLLGIHGVSATGMIAVGQAKVGSNNYVPAAYQRASNGAWLNLSVNQVQNLPTAATTLRSVWVLDATHAYLVGEAGTLLVWNGTSLSLIARPSGVGDTTSFNSVVAFNPSSVYVVDSDQRIRRWNGQSWQLLQDSVGQPLDAITGVSTSDLWVAGQNDLTLHWHEP